MKKFLLIFFLLASMINAQDGFNTLQRKSLIDSLAIRDATLDSLGIAIANLGVLNLPTLNQGKLWLGDAANQPAARTISGDFTINYLGVGAIGTSKITNSMLAGSIGASKLETGVLSQSELLALNNFDTETYGTIEARFLGLELGTGFILSTGDEMEGNLLVQDDVYLLLGDDNNMGMYYDSGDDISNFLSNNKLRIGTVTSDDFEFYSGGSLRLTLNSSGVLIPKSDIIPSTTNTSDLGSTTSWFDNVFGRKVLFRTAYSNDSPAGSELSIPSHLTHPSTAGTFRHNDIYTLSQDSYTNVGGTVVDKNGFYLLAYYDEDPLTRPYFPDSTEIENMVDARLMASAKTLSQVDTDSIDFTNTNTIFGYYEASDEFEIYFANYQSNIAQQIVIYTQYDININAPTGVTLLYADGLPITVSSVGYYRIWFTYLSPTLCLVDWNVYEAP